MPLLVLLSIFNKLILLYNSSCLPNFISPIAFKNQCIKVYLVCFNVIFDIFEGMILRSNAIWFLPSNYFYIDQPFDCQRVTRTNTCTSSILQEWIVIVMWVNSHLRKIDTYKLCHHLSSEHISYDSSCSNYQYQSWRGAATVQGALRNFLRFF